MRMMPPFLRPLAIGVAFGAIAFTAVVFVTEESGDAAASNQPFRVKPTAVTRKVSPPNINALVSKILARPLFNPSRQPVQEGLDQIAEAPKYPPKMPGRLQGVTIRPQVREALFEREGQKPIAVNEGQEIEGWTVVSIRADSVLLKSSAGDQIVKPSNGADIKPAQMQAMNRQPARSKLNPTMSAPSATPPAQPVGPANQLLTSPRTPARAKGDSQR